MQTLLSKRHRRIGWSLTIATVAAAGSAAVWSVHNGPRQATVASSDVAATWLTDPEAGLRSAAARGKDVLIEFAAPDPTDSRVDVETLDTTAFRQAAGERFVLVRLSPSTESAPTATQTTVWAQRFNVTALPQIVLTDSAGRPYAKLEINSDHHVEASSCLADLALLQQKRIQRDVAFARADTVQGVDRARSLDAALATVGPFAQLGYSDVMRQIMDLDPANTAGLRTKYEPLVSAQHIDAAIQAEVYPLIDRGELGAAAERVGKLIEEHRPASGQLQLLLAFQGQLYYSLGDRHRAAALIERAIRVDPASESAARIREAQAQIQGAAS